MSEMNITIGETNKRHGKLKTALLAFAIVAALLVTPVVTAESASAASTSGYTTCAANKKAGVQAVTKGLVKYTVHSFGTFPSHYDTREVKRLAYSTPPTSGWNVTATYIKYAYNYCH